ncbi:hypothetical protein F8M41_000088 [Gigaspora margarita]|uniref:Uncharacterized protein n=1 Tax=Gigaspora margarita TaxID=4874 RepID=A0A8H4B5V2_GIGMA|nr:hypothetical protein F8M41_000088 [Gigaspora margarita]
MDFGNSSTYSTEPFDPDNDHFYSLISLFGGVFFTSFQNRPNPSKPSIISIYLNYSLDLIYCAYATLVISFAIDQNATCSRNENCESAPDYEISLTIIIIICAISTLLSIVNIIRNQKLNYWFSYKKMLYVTFFLNHIILPTLLLAFVLYVNSKENDISSRYRIIAWVLPFLFIISLLGLCFLQLIRRCIDNNNQERERDRMSEQEAGENNIPPNAKYTNIVSAQRCCFQIIFLVSVGIFIAVGFFLASSKTSSQAKNLFLTFLSGLVGNIILRRVFLTNTRTDRTSSIDYILSSQETKERIIEMFTFEKHYYSHEFILTDVNKHLPLNTRQN